MGLKRILAAATDWRTLLLLGAGLVAAAALSNPFPALIGLGVYLWAVQRLAASPQLARAAEQAQLAERLAERYRELQQTMREVSGRLPTAPMRGESRSAAYRAQLVVNAAISVYKEWLAKPDPLPDRAGWVEEAIRLAHHYLRILHAYHELYLKGGATAEIRMVQERLRRNRERLKQTTDMEARRLLIQAIELDERVASQEVNHEAEAQRYMAKLAAIEASLDALRRRLHEPDAAAEGSRIHDLLLEAAAMDEALEEVQHRARVRVR